MEKEKKEIGIEKLIELLNEYEIEREMEIGTFELSKIPYREWSLDMGDLVFEPNYKDKKYEDCIGDTANSALISKSFGFIKWLVENDKIDLDAQAMQYAKSDLSKFFTEWKDKNGMSDDYAMLLMLLSISDTPIEDLLLYLK